MSCRIPDGDAPPSPADFVHDGSDDGRTDWKEECRKYFGTEAMDGITTDHPTLSWEAIYLMLWAEYAFYGRRASAKQRAAGKARRKGPGHAGSLKG